VLNALDDQFSARFGYDEVQEWEPDALEALVSCGLLKEVDHARCVACDGCDRCCIADIEFITHDDDGPPRAFVVCQERDDIGRVPVKLERLRRWQATGSTLAAAVAHAVGIDGTPEECVPERLWFLGKPSFGDAARDVFVVGCSARADELAAIRDCPPLREAQRPLILAPASAKRFEACAEDAILLSLDRVMSVEGGRLHLGVSEAAVAVRPPASRTQDVVPFNTGQDSSWEHVIIEFCNDEVVKVAAGGHSDHRTAAQMGFVDRRRSGEVPDRLWLFLRELAKHEGEIAWGDATDMSSSERAKAKRYVSDIRKRLRTLFPDLPGNPFEPYRSVGAYKTRFVLRWSEQYRRSSR